MLEFRALAERVRVCQERLEKQEQALGDVSHVIHSETCGLCGYPINTASCQLFQRRCVSRSPVYCNVHCGHPYSFLDQLISCHGFHVLSFSYSHVPLANNIYFLQPPLPPL